MYLFHSLSFSFFVIFNLFLSFQLIMAVFLSICLTVNLFIEGKTHDCKTKIKIFFSQFSVNVLKFIQPTVIFSAHDHRGMDYIGTRKTGRSTGNITWFSQNKPDPDSEFLVLKTPPVIASE
jgi:hypothetical protein